jgi:hypothetical protein
MLYDINQKEIKPGCRVVFMYKRTSNGGTYLTHGTIVSVTQKTAQVLPDDERLHGWQKATKTVKPDRLVVI